MNNRKNPKLSEHSIYATYGENFQLKSVLLQGSDNWNTSHNKKQLFVRPKLIRIFKSKLAT